MKFNADDVLQLLADKMTRSEIAERLKVKPTSVWRIIARVRRERPDRSVKLNVRKEARLWTDEEYQRALELKREKWTNDEIGEELGRSGPAVAVKLSSQEARELRASAGWLLDIGQIRLSEQQLTERNARQEASYRRDFTANLMGDPPPGYSARDRRGM